MFSSGVMKVAVSPITVDAKIISYSIVINHLISRENDETAVSKGFFTYDPCDYKIKTVLTIPPVILESI